MSPQLTIIAAAMSLGGMASVGYNHHEQVEKQVSEYHEKKETEVKNAEVADVGEQMVEAIVGVEENLNKRLQENEDNVLAQVAWMRSQVENLQSKQSSQDVLLERMAEDYTALEFRWETLSKGFRPLPSIGGRFTPVQGQSQDAAHPLLPAVSGESSWTNDY